MGFFKNPFKIKWVFPAFFFLNILTRRFRPNAVPVDKMTPILDDAHRDDHHQSTEVIEIHSRTCHSQCGLLIRVQLSRNDHHMFSVCRNSSSQGWSCAIRSINTMMQTHLHCRRVSPSIHLQALQIRVFRPEYAEFQMIFTTWKFSLLRLPEEYSALAENNF